MPLRDHFRPPLDDRRHWEGFHAGWPMMIVANLRHKLPPGYFAEPRVRLGTSAEIDVGSLEDESEVSAVSEGNGGVATAVWAPPRPTFAVTTDWPAQDLYEVQVFDERSYRRLVAAVEIVSPGNKDRPEARRAFIAKCASLLREHVSVVIVDVVTTRTQNLYTELLSMLGHADPSMGSEPLYSTACRVMKPGDDWLLEAWSHTLSLGEALPTLPLWLADDLAVPLELEASYEESCDILGIAALFPVPRAAADAKHGNAG
jgi:hypothetical protein